MEEEFFQWVYFESKGNGLIDMLENKFNQLEIMEHYFNSWTLNMSRDDYSIGFVFSLLEDLKNMFDVGEYSIS